MKVSKDAKGKKIMNCCRREIRFCRFFCVCLLKRSFLLNSSLGLANKVISDTFTAFWLSEPLKMCSAVWLLDE